MEIFYRGFKNLLTIVFDEYLEPKRLENTALADIADEINGILVISHFCSFLKFLKFCCEKPEFFFFNCFSNMFLYFLDFVSWIYWICQFAFFTHYLVSGLSTIYMEINIPTSDRQIEKFYID